MQLTFSDGTVYLIDHDALNRIKHHHLNYHRDRTIVARLQAGELKI